MIIEHLMIRIEKTYGKLIQISAKKYTPRGTDWQDVYQEILISVHDRVRRRKVGLRDQAAMRTTIKQRAIEQSRKALLYQERFKMVSEVDAETIQSSDSPTSIPEEMRVLDLKIQLRKRLPALDAYIVMELAFQPSRALVLMREHPVRPRSKRKRPMYYSLPAKVHVAQLFDVSIKRVTEAIERAKKVVNDIIGEEESVQENRKTTCQMCSQEKECQIVRCRTRHLYREGMTLTGKKGTALLSVCLDCETVFGEGGK